MPVPEPSCSAPTTQSSRFPAGRARSSTTDHPHHFRVFSAQHLDDVSNYHEGGHSSEHRNIGNEALDPNDIEMIRQEDHGETEQPRDNEIPERRDGIPDEKDLEANLEKIPTIRSFKDPNLVSVCCR